MIIKGVIEEMLNIFKFIDFGGIVVLLIKEWKEVVFVKV